MFWIATKDFFIGLSSILTEGMQYIREYFLFTKHNKLTVFEEGNFYILAYQRITLNRNIKKMTTYIGYLTQKYHFEYFFKANVSVTVCNFAWY